MPEQSAPVPHEQLPDTHEPPTGQTFPHAPQFEKLVLVATHVPPQSVWPAGQ